MRRLTIAAALTMLALPAFAQSAPTDNSVRCNCAPAPVAVRPIHHARVVRHNYRRGPVVTAYAPPPVNFGYATTATAYAPPPASFPTPRVRGILGPITQSEESIAYYGLGYTDGYIGAEASAGGPGPTGAGY